MKASSNQHLDCCNQHLKCGNESPCTDEEHNDEAQFPDTSARLEADNRPDDKESEDSHLDKRSNYRECTESQYDDCCDDAANHLLFAHPVSV